VRREVLHGPTEEDRRAVHEAAAQRRTAGPPSPPTWMEDEALALAAADPRNGPLPRVLAWLAWAYNRSPCAPSSTCRTCRSSSPRACCRRSGGAWAFFSFPPSMQQPADRRRRAYPAEARAGSAASWFCRSGWAGRADAVAAASHPVGRLPMRSHTCSYRAVRGSTTRPNALLRAG
jgi:hypothetical protein